MKSILDAKFNREQGITELFLEKTNVGWVRRVESGSYFAHSHISGKTYRGKNISDVCLLIEGELLSLAG